MSTLRELLAQAARLDRAIRAERVRRIRAAMVVQPTVKTRLHTEVLLMEEAIRLVICDYEMFDEHLTYIEDLLLE